MNIETQEFKRLLLEKLKELELQDDLGSQGQKTVKLDQQAVGRLSRMDALQSQAMSKATAQRRDLEKQKINLALKRIIADEFGFCEDCGEEISKARLTLDPTVMRCISCAKG